MKFYSTFILATFFSNSLIAGIFDSETKVKLEFCDEKNSFIVYTYSVDTEKIKVFEKQEIFRDKKIFKTDLQQLGNCVILNKNNWKCGGVKTYFPNQKDGKTVVGIDNLKKLVDGKFYWEWSHYEINGIPEEEKICYKFTQY